MNEKAKVFYPRFTCRAVPNGGWLIEHEGGRMEMANVVAAFTNTGDFLAYLNSHVVEAGLGRVENTAPWGQIGGAE